VCIVLGGISVGKRLINVITLTDQDLGRRAHHHRGLEKVRAGQRDAVRAAIDYERQRADGLWLARRDARRQRQVLRLHWLRYAILRWFEEKLGAESAMCVDKVSCLVGEAVNPRKNIPRAVLGTVLGAALLSILATLSIVGMQH